MLFGEFLSLLVKRVSFCSAIRIVTMSFFVTGFHCFTSLVNSSFRTILLLNRFVVLLYNSCREQFFSFVVLSGAAVFQHTLFLLFWSRHPTLESHIRRKCNFLCFLCHVNGKAACYVVPCFFWQISTVNAAMFA